MEKNMKRNTFMYINMNCFSIHLRLINIVNQLYFKKKKKKLLKGQMALRNRKLRDALSLFLP